MKIAVLDLLFCWPPEGGARIDVKEVCARLAKKHELCMFAPRYNYALDRGKVDGDVGFPVKTIPFTWISFNRWGITRKFRKAIREFQPDLVYITDGWHLKPWAAWAVRDFPYMLRFYAYENICLRLHGTFMRGSQPCYRTHLGPAFRDYFYCNACTLKHMIRAKMMGWFQTLFEYLAATAFLPTYPSVVKNMYKNAKHIIGYNALHEKFVGPYNTNISLVPSAFDEDRFPELPFRKSHAIRIGFPGRVNDEQKGYSLARRIFSKLQEMDLGLDVELWLTGDGTPDLPPIPGVIFKGWYPQEELSRFYAELDIVLVPSLWQEPFGMVAVEGMASGKPVIVSQVGGLQNIVEHGVTGYVAPPDDPDAWVEIIVNLINSPDLRREIGKKASKSAREKYTWDTIVSTYYLPLLEKIERSL